MKDIVRQLIIVAVCVAVLWTAIAIGFGAQNSFLYSPFYVVASGSMYTELAMYDLIIISGPTSVFHPAPFEDVEVGDIIVKFDGKEISFSSDLPPLVGGTLVGSTVPVDIIRRSKSKRIKIKILELPTDDQMAAKNSANKPDSLKNPLNIVVKSLTEEQKKQIDIYDHGVLVEDISSGPAQESGIRRGDVLLLLDNIKIKNVEHFNKLVKQLPKERSISVLIQRRDGPVFLALKLEK